MLAIWESFSIKQCYFAFPANVPPFRLSETSASKMMKLNCIEKQCIEKQTHYSADKGPYSQGYGLPSGHIWLSELDWKEGRAPKNWCLGTVALRLPWTARRSDKSVFSSVAQLCLTLRLHGLQHARLPCPSPTPGACSNSCPSSRWCHPTISSSVARFSSRLQSLPVSGSFPMSQFFASGGQSIGA